MTKPLQISKRLCAALLLAMLTNGLWASPFNVTGKVIYVNDGDTIVLLAADKTQLKIRLSSIDAPETAHTNQETGRVGQPYSVQAGKHLASIIKTQTVEAQCFEKDKYGREVCEIFLDGLSVNREMVRQGWAWANVAAQGRYLRDKSLPAVQQEAETRRMGLWTGFSPVAPWEWRDRCWKQGRCDF